jgi:thiamine biosynthesis lipoprotein
MPDAAFADDAASGIASSADIDVAMVDAMARTRRCQTPLARHCRCGVTMKRRQILRVALGLGALAAFGDAPASTSLRWQRRELVGFGTTLSLQAAHEDDATLSAALDDAVVVLQRIEQQMSLFRDDSALSRLNREGRLASPPAELRELLGTARDVARRSDGAFDPTVQPLWLAFADAQAQGRLPTPAEVAAARALVDWRGLLLDADGTVRLARRGMGLTLNGIAQGYAADRVRGVLMRHGIVHALVDAGEYAMTGRNPQGARWTLGIADPHARERLLARLFADGRCVATSGDDQTSFSTDHRHHHIFDPHTGYSPADLSGVTVAAASGALADALTKVFFVAGPERAAALARRWNVDALWVDKSGRWAATPGLRIGAA